jgi:hypothetical protein
MISTPVKLAILTIVSCSSFAYSQPLDLQATCAAQARKAFYEWQAESKKSESLPKILELSNDYQSHYNTKLKKCFILVESSDVSGNTQTINVYLSDAYERRIYASYLWFSSQTKKYWEVAPMTCELIPSLREKKYCKSREE